jgi:diamine N-acetyltransferase
MSEVHLRRITDAIEQACVGLRVGDDQVRFVAPNAESLAQARANPLLVSLAIYDRTACGYPEPHVPMIGFVMYEIDWGSGLSLAS